MPGNFTTSETDSPETETAWGYRLTRVETLGLLLILIAVFGYFQILFPLLLALLMLTGWAFYLGRVVSSGTISIKQLSWFFGLLLLSGSVLHLLLKSLFRGVQRAQTGDSATSVAINWRKRWTLALFVIVLTLSSFSFALSGLGHEVWGMLTTHEKLVLVQRGGRRVIRNISKTNLKQIGLALHNYHDTFARFPAAGTFDRTGQPQHSWTTRLLPYLDQAYLYNQIDFAQPWTATDNRPVFETRLPPLQNPKLYYDYHPGDRRERDEHRLKPAHYAVNTRVLNVNRGPNLEEIKDGASNTVLAGEVKSRIKAWGDPANFRDPTLGINADPRGFGGPSQGGACFLLGDGSVRFISEDIDPAILKALATPNGGEPVGDF